MMMGDASRMRDEKLCRPSNKPTKIFEKIRCNTRKMVNFQMCCVNRPRSLYILVSDPRTSRNIQSGACCRPRMHGNEIRKGLRNRSHPGWSSCRREQLANLPKGNAAFAAVNMCRVRQSNDEIAGKKTSRWQMDVWAAKGMTWGIHMTCRQNNCWPSFGETETRRMPVKRWMDAPNQFNGESLCKELEGEHLLFGASCIIALE